MKISKNEYETSLRLLLLLSVINQPTTEERLNGLDLISIFAKDFEIFPDNLFGDSPFNLSVLAERKNEIHRALIHLVQAAYVEVTSNDCFSFSISSRGQHVLKELNDQFAKDYLRAAAVTLRHFLHLSEIELNNLILKTAVYGEYYERNSDKED